MRLKEAGGLRSTSESACGMPITHLVVSYFDWTVGEHQGTCLQKNPRLGLGTQGWGVTITEILLSSVPFQGPSGGQCSFLPPEEVPK